MSYVLQVEIRVKPGNVDSFMRKVLENAASARNEPGCKQFDVVVDPKDPTSMMLYEVYADERAFEEHQKTAAFKKYVDEAVPLLASRVRHYWTRVEAAR